MSFLASHIDSCGPNVRSVGFHFTMATVGRWFYVAIVAAFLFFASPFFDFCSSLLEVISRVMPFLFIP